MSAVSSFLKAAVQGAVNGGQIPSAISEGFVDALNAASFIKSMRILATAGLITGGLWQGLAGMSWWSMAYAVLNVGVQIAGLFATGGLFLAFVLASLVVNVAGLVVTIMHQPTSCWPVPLLYGLSPSTCVAGSTPPVVTVLGKRFVNQPDAHPPVQATAQWNGSSRITAIRSSSELTIQLVADDIANAGTGSITVTNPDTTPSNPLTFTITAS